MNITYPCGCFMVIAGCNDGNIAASKTCDLCREQQRKDWNEHCGYVPTKDFINQKGETNVGKNRKLCDY